MLIVRFSAKDLRTIQGAESQEQLKGLKDLVLSRIQEATTNKEMKPAREAGNNTLGDKYLWREARVDLEAVLGKDLRVPPFPDTGWYANINRAIKEQGMDAAYVTALAQYAKLNLRPPYSMDFLIRQHLRVLAGEWSHKTTAPAAPAPKTNWLNDRLPE